MLASFALGFAGHAFPGTHAFAHGGGHGGTSHVGAVHASGPHGGVLHAGGHAAPTGAAHGGAGHGADVDEGISPFNMATILAFFTWFGGIGYVLSAYLGLLTILALLGASVGGLLGASVVFLFLARLIV